LMLSSHLCLGFSSVFSLRFPHQNSVYNSPLNHMCYMPPSHYSLFYYLNNIWQGVEIIELLDM
jgi:hypothetical protein